MIGIHINSSIDNLVDELDRVKKLGGNIIQLFVEPLAKTNAYDKFIKHLNKLKMSCVVHISYTINCSKQWTEYSWWIKQFILEIEQAAKIGARSVVVHLGKQLELSKEEALNNMYSCLLYVHQQTKNYSHIKILLETSSGQGSEMCFMLDDLAYFYKKLSHNKNESIRQRFGLCIDTCHIFASGHDLRSKKLVSSYIKMFQKKIGIEHIKLVHLNDSKKDLASHVDRHENIGKGFIGKEPLIYIAEFFKDLEVGIILETPLESQEQDIKLIK